MIQELFDNGYAAGFVLFILALEAAWLASHGWGWLRILQALGPAVFIVLAVWAALVGASWHWVALALAASFPLHLFDIRYRMNTARQARGE
ncbi:MAG: hypothetical protein AAF251_17820 [Pseudomonadota bacterium]